MVVTIIVPLISLALFAGKSDAIFGMSSKTSVIVDFPYLDIEGLVKLCDSKQQDSHKIKQLRRVSSIRWLNTNLERLGTLPSSTGEDVTCPDTFREPLIELEEIIEARQPDACSTKHIFLVEKFHKKYIEHDLLDLKETKLDHSVLPEPFKWFFIHYALSLSEVCQENLRQNLELMSKSSLSSDYETILNAFPAKFEDNLRYLVDSSIENREDSILIWNMFDLYKLKNKLDKDQDPIKLRLKAKDPSQFEIARQKCRNNFQPIYSETALSSMRLINLGYKSNGKQADNSMIQNWYIIVQLCDFMLGIEIYEDPTLQPEQVVTISKVEASSLKLAYKSAATTASEYPVKFYKKPASFLDKDDTLVTVTSDEDPNKLYKLIKSNAKSLFKNFKRKHFAQIILTS